MELERISTSFGAPDPYQQQQTQQQHMQQQLPGLEMEGLNPMFP